MAIKFVTTGVWGAGEGSPLNAADVDENFYEVLQQIAAVASAEGVGVASITALGNQLTFTMTDASTHTVTVPTATWVFKGEWETATFYSAFDVITNNQSVYLVIRAHESDAVVFDPDAFSIDGPLYALILQSAPQRLFPADIHFVVLGTIADNNTLLYRLQTLRQWELPANLVGSLFTATEPATADAACFLFRGSDQIGSITWLADTTEPVIDFPADITFDVGDIFEIFGPDPTDVTLKDATFGFRANYLELDLGVVS